MASVLASTAQPMNCGSLPRQLAAKQPGPSAAALPGNSATKLIIATDNTETARTIFLTLMPRATSLWFILLPPIGVSREAVRVAGALSVGHKPFDGDLCKVLFRCYNGSTKRLYQESHAKS